ncbi:alpha/beta fold hydrolase [Novosphingobium bradum]|uniref:Alpha/beta fold hydrolase n=1 Tax=Novosphingobium bradum TaxID=1737444 RepID=A0ABV7IKX2_9SPHN
MQQPFSPMRRIVPTDGPIFPLAGLNGARPPAPAWFENALAVAPERGEFFGNGVPIELLTWGEVGKPGLLFLHGYAGHADWWSFVAPFFAADYRCAAISFAGMGRSGHRPGGIYDFGAWADDAHQAIAAAGLDASGARPVVVAQSMAGFVALLAAIRHDCFSGLIPIDTGYRTEALPPADRVRLGQGHRDRLFATVAEGLARYRLSPDQPCANPFVLDHVARLSLREADGGWRWLLDPAMTTDLRLCWEPEMLRQAACPMAYVHGQRSALVAHRIAGIRAALKPGDVAIEIPDADHNVLADQPLALIAVVRTVLAGWRAEAAIGKGAGR